MLALWHKVFLGLADFRRNNQLALALGFARVGDSTRDFGNHGHVLGLANFKELGHARKTTHDILGLGCFAGLTGDDVASLDVCAVLDHDDGADGQGVDRRSAAVAALFDAAVFIADGDGRAEVGGAVFHNGQGCLTGNIVHLFLHGLAVDDVRKTDNAFFFADKGFVERTHSASTTPLVTSCPSWTSRRAPLGRMYFSRSRP